MPAPRSQPTSPRPAALVVSDSALARVRLPRRLRRAGADVGAAVDPWAAEAELARGGWDVVVWAAPRQEGLVRSLVHLVRPAALLLVVEEGAAPGRIVDGLGAGAHDIVRWGTEPDEVVARAVALGRRASRVRALGRTADAFRELAEGGRDLLMRVDADGVVLFASAAAREMLGSDPREVEGRRALDLCHPDERGALERAMEGDAPTGVDPVLIVHRLRTRAGAWTWVETTVRAVRDPSGRLAEAHTDSRDISARRRDDAERTALARVTAAVAAAAPIDDLATLVAREAAVLMSAETAAVVRFHGDEGLAIGAAGPVSRVGDRIPLAVLSPGAVVAPVAVEGRPWGVVMVRGIARPAAGDADRLRALAGLMTLALANALGRERLVALATTDPLTGLVNHRTFHERLGAACARSRRDGGPVGLVLVDLDHFKRINDTHGHQVGDDVLREVARRLRARCRREDVVARVGGEELAWLLPGAGAAAATEAAERLRHDIGGTPFPGVGRVTASMGVAAHADDGPQGLLRRADLALYRAKEGGRDACVAWDGAVDVTAARSG